MSSGNPTRGSARAGKSVPAPKPPPLRRPGADVIKVLRLASAGKMPDLAEQGLMTPDINEYVLLAAASYLAGFDSDHAHERLKAVAVAYRRATAPGQEKGR
jgi:predicted exporter